jgi:fermentation-respiration switch protein FrsA (DUF1100 family)
VLAFLLTFVIAGYLGYGLLLYVLQDRMVFPAPGIDRGTLEIAAAEVGARGVDLVASDGVRLYGWHRTKGHDRVILYFHGNGETVAGNVGLQRLLLNAGWDVFALAYRGYPGSEGAPSERGVVRDALAAWDWAVASGYEPDRVVLHGRSLGGAVAAHLAEQRNPAALVLESTFVSVKAMAKRQAPLYPVDWLLRHPFDTIERLPRIGVPTLVMHSRDDEVVPVHLGGRELHLRLAEGVYHETGGYGHDDCLPVVDPALRQVYLAFLDKRVPR